MAIAGKATVTGTRSYRERHQSDCVVEHFREFEGLVASSIGIGTYLGQPDEQTDTLVTNAIIESARRGLNLIDTAINYRYMHAEWSVAKALSHLVSSGEVRRDELILCTKGGFIPHQNRVEWFYAEYVENSNFAIKASDLVAGCHCMHPEYIQDQLSRSLDNLGVETVDIYYLHNVEMQLSEVSEEVFYKRLREAFEVLETAVNAGKINAYGLATWSGFRVAPNASNHIDLEKAKAIASQVAASDHFKFIQLPVNLGMLEALLKPTQRINDQLIPAIEAANSLDIAAIASASIGQTKVLDKIPAMLASELEENSLSEAMKALQFTRSVPGVLSALVGMKTSEHLEENLTLSRIKPLDSTRIRALLH